MKDDQYHFHLVTRQGPGRFDVQQTAYALGFSAEDVPILVRSGFLKPLGEPVDNARKYFAAKTVLELAMDPAWLSKATRAIQRYWSEKNGRRSPGFQTVPHKAGS